jgi:hypothetical protein
MKLARMAINPKPSLSVKAEITKTKRRGAYIAHRTVNADLDG